MFANCAACKETQIFFKPLNPIQEPGRFTQDVLHVCHFVQGYVLHRKCEWVRTLPRSTPSTSTICYCHTHRNPTAPMFYLFVGNFTEKGLSHPFWKHKNCNHFLIDIIEVSVRKCHLSHKVTLRRSWAPILSWKFLCSRTSRFVLETSVFPFVPDVSWNEKGYSCVMWIRLDGIGNVPCNLFSFLSEIGSGIQVRVAPELWRKLLN